VRSDFRPALCKGISIEPFRVSKKSGKAPEIDFGIRTGSADAEPYGFGAEVGGE
jgi:hypothetical protein